MVLVIVGSKAYMFGVQSVGEASPLEDPHLKAVLESFRFIAPPAKAK